MKRSISLGDAIEAFLQERGLKEKVLVERVITDWPRIMGAAIGENTEKIWFKDGTFYIRMRTPIWRNELSMAKSKIKDILNRELGATLVQEVKVF